MHQSDIPLGAELEQEVDLLSAVLIEPPEDSLPGRLVGEPEHVRDLVAIQPPRERLEQFDV